MISATARVPVEIWSRILRFAIAVPIFFDSDPIEQHNLEAIQQYNWELPYWSVERHRNAFRRACSSWDGYLRQFDHRYIRLTDIVHKAIPQTAFPRAIRLYLGFCECEICICAEYNPWVGSLNWEINDREERITFLVDQYHSKSRLEILHGDSFMENELALFSTIGTLKVFVGRSINHLLQPGATPLLQSLRMFLGRNPANEPCESAYMSVGQPIHLSSITTLSIEVVSFEALEGMTMPSLKHLSVTVSSDNQHRQAVSLIFALKALGSLLESFHWTDQLVDEPMPQDIWSVFPKVQSLQTPYKWGVRPPADHPVDRITLTFKNIVFWDLTGGLRNVRDHLPLTGDTRFEQRGVVLSYYWCQLIFSPGTLPSMSVLWEAMQVAEDDDVFFTDQAGLYLEEYIHYFLVNIWRRNITTREYRRDDMIYSPMSF